MTKFELAEYVSEQMGMSGVAGRKVVDIVIAGIQKGLEIDGKVVLRKFGTFNLVEKPARKFKYYINGGGEKDLPARKVNKFVASPASAKE